MSTRNIIKLGLVSAIALTAGYGAYKANAQSASQIGATFTTAAGIESTPVLDIDFGTWVVNIVGGETPTIVQGAVTTGSPGAGTVAGATTSLVQNTIAPANSGIVEVTAPVAGNLQIQGTVTTDFSDPDISLSNITFSDSVQTNVAVPATFNGLTLVSVTTGGVAEPIAFGGTLTLGGAGGSPAPATTFNDALIDVDFTFQ